MEHPRSAVHRTIVVVDVEGFGDQRRTNPQRIMVRDSLYKILRNTFDKVDISWEDCYQEDRGDGVLILVPSTIPKSVFVESMIVTLVETLGRHNQKHCIEEQIRLRMSLHAGEINYDDHGVVGASINLAFRLLDASEFRTALTTSRGPLALIVSSWFFDEVVQHSKTSKNSTYHGIQVAVKETTTVAWIHLPGHPRASLTLQPHTKAIRNGDKDASVASRSSTDLTSLNRSATATIDVSDGPTDDLKITPNCTQWRNPYRILNVAPTFKDFLRESFIEVISRTSSIFECRDVRTARGIPHSTTRRKHIVHVVTYFTETNELSLPIHSYDFRDWLETVEQQPVLLLLGQILRPGKLTLRMLCLHDWLIQEATRQPDWKRIQSLPLKAFKPVGRHGARFHRIAVQEVDRVTGGENSTWQTLKDGGLVPVDEMTLLEFMELARFLEVPQPVFKRLATHGDPTELIVGCIRRNQLSLDPVIDSWLTTIRELSRYEPAGFERRQFRLFTRFLKNYGRDVQMPRYSSAATACWRTFTAMYPDVLKGISHVINKSTRGNEIAFAASLLSTLTLANDRVVSFKAGGVLQELRDRTRDFPQYYVRREILRSLVEGGERSWLPTAIEILVTEGTTGEEQRYLNAYGWTNELVEAKIERRLNQPTLRDQQMREYLAAMGDVFTYTSKLNVRDRAY
jgi:hypothetical protein